MQSDNNSFTSCKALDDLLNKPDNVKNGAPNFKGSFVRLTLYNPDIDRFIERYYKLCRRCGGVFENKLANPSAEETAHSLAALKGNFSPSEAYISGCLKNALSLEGILCGRLAEEISRCLCDTEKKGMNDNIRKNVFVKFLCWLKKYFEASLSAIPRGETPKLLYFADPGKHDLWLLGVLSKCGFDVLLILRDEAAYNAADPTGALSVKAEPGGISFPKDYSLDKFKSYYDSCDRLIADFSRDVKTEIIPNVWLSGELLKDIERSPESRGSICNNAGSRIFTLYGRINGAEDKNAYLAELYNMYLRLKAQRRVLVIDEGIKPPSNDEIAAVRRGNYSDVFSLIKDLSKNIVHSSAQLQGLMRKAFGEVMLEYFENKKDVRRALAKAVYLLCWLKRYQFELFSGWKAPETAVLLFMGGCKDGKESLFLKLISRLPADVLIFAPDLEKKCALHDPRLFERNFVNSFPVQKFPRDEAALQMGTVAFYAERELDGMLYNDTGLYRNQQFTKANSLRLRSTYEEIALLWNEEVKYRPNFTASGGTAVIPVIAAKISGVKDKDVKNYWDNIYDLITEDTAVIANSPIISEKYPGSAGHIVDRSGRLQIRDIKQNSAYRYGFLSEERQDYILEKIKLLIEASPLTPAETAAVGLSLSSELLRVIQKFDFTGKNPKLIYINTTETVITPEDSVITALLGLLGFDVLYFLPTGYRCAESYLKPGAIEEHKIGEYMFDLAVPDFKNYRRTKRKGSIFDRFFK
ncbi:MAG: YceG family protein [Oscillospiraceae bacterium]|nr:YceG family protein [Oscillospiraceae bacterium]